MSGFGAQCRKRLEELRKAGQDIPKIIDEVAEVATIEAVRKARDWGQEEKGTTEDEMAGWHHRFNGHEFE